MQKRATPFSDIEFETTIAPVQPWNQGVPCINGPSVYGASPKREFLYLIPTTGERPMRFRAESLPARLSLDADKGVITGKAENAGTFDVTLTAENRLGKDSKLFKIVIGDHSLALTPPLGWNSWNCFRSDINQTQITEVTDAMLSSGLAAHGYRFVNLDSGWQSKRRGGQFNSIVPADTFPDMQSLCEHIHALGLKAGIYSSPYVRPWGTDGLGTTDGIPDTSFPFSYYKFVGMNRHELEDARQWAAWGFDYLKYDWVVTDMFNAAKMREALDATGRDMLYSLVIQVALKDAPKASELANLYRANADTTPTWDSISKIGFGNGEWNPYIGPGHWLDLDMLATTPRDGKSLTRNEMLSHISCWMMRPSPIMLDCDP
ncbi:MAG: putative Ig domain-containing protein, partial [Victivallales bacterium]|nr:putative Ig domain-containing protein [Victivallales bacterium]